GPDGQRANGPVVGKFYFESGSPVVEGDAHRSNRPLSYMVSPTYCRPDGRLFPPFLLFAVSRTALACPLPDIYHQATATTDQGPRTKNHVHRQKPSAEESTGPRPQCPDAGRTDQDLNGRGALEGGPGTVQPSQGEGGQSGGQEGQEGQGRRETGRRGSGPSGRGRPGRREEIETAALSKSHGRREGSVDAFWRPSRFPRSFGEALEFFDSRHAAAGGTVCVAIQATHRAQLADEPGVKLPSKRAPAAPVAEVTFPGTPSTVK